MRTLYLDTSVFLARYAPTEKEHESSKKVLAAIEEATLRAVTSVLTLVEIASAVRRSSLKFKGPPEPIRDAGAFVRRALSVKNLSFVPLGEEIPLKAPSGEVRTPAVLLAALRAVRDVPLRTLDLLHIASAYVAQKIFGEDLDFFTTLDEGILAKRRELKSLLGSSILSPSELARLEGL